MANTTASEARRRLDRLRALKADPPRQADFAAEIFETETNPDVLMSVLSALAVHPRPALRPALVARYGWFDALGPRRDPGGMVRQGILRALRDIAHPDDRELFDRATRTYESSVQDRANPAGVRAAGLIALFNLDQPAAVHRAIELIGDVECIDSPALEPAGTAIRILGEGDAYESLVTLLLLRADLPGELLGEALKGLSHAPATALGAVVARYGRASREMALLGLCDLLIENRAESLVPAFGQLLRSAPPDVLRYLVTAAVASRREEFAAPLSAAAREATGRARMVVFDEGLALSHDPEVIGARAELQARLALAPAGPNTEDEEESVDGEDGKDDGSFEEAAEVIARVRRSIGARRRP